VSQHNCIVTRQDAVVATSFVGGDVNAPNSNPKVRLSLDCTQATQQKYQQQQQSQEKQQKQQ
jgi:hypothetical protein